MILSINSTIVMGRSECSAAKSIHLAKNRSPRILIASDYQPGFDTSGNPLRHLLRQLLSLNVLNQAIDV
jgi:hypothetical protein